MNLSERLAGVMESIAAAAADAGRDPGTVKLVAVSKTHPPEAVGEMAALGHRVFGESRVQEALAKIPVCPGNLEWHFIGHLQKNKIRKAIGQFAMFHGIDRLELAQDMQRIAEEEGCHPKILIEVNTSGEASKFGFEPDQLEARLGDLLELPRLEIHGLMTMAPLVPEPHLARPCFARLRELRDRLEVAAGVRLPELSMGMSGDFREAIAEGSTMVRIGTAIFGGRPG